MAPLGGAEAKAGTTHASSQSNSGSEDNSKHDVEKVPGNSTMIAQLDAGEAHTTTSETRTGHGIRKNANTVDWEANDPECPLKLERQEEDLRRWTGQHLDIPHTLGLKHDCSWYSEYIARFRIYQ